MWFRRSLLVFVVALGWGHALAADPLPEVKVYYSDWPGMSATVSGAPVGPVFEVLAAITANGGPRFKLINVPWKRALHLTAQDNSAALLPLTRIPERERSYRWLAPLLTYRSVLVTIKQPPPRTMDEAKLLSVGVVAAGALDHGHVLTKLGFTKIERVTTDLTNAVMLHAGHIDSWAADDTTAAATYMLAGYDPKELNFGLPLSDERVVYLAAGLGFPAEMAKAIDKAYKQADRDKKLDGIRKRYRPGN